VQYKRAPLPLSVAAAKRVSTTPTDTGQPVTGSPALLVSPTTL